MELRCETYLDQSLDAASSQDHTGTEDGEVAVVVESRARHLQVGELGSALSVALFLRDEIWAFGRAVNGASMVTL